MGSAEGNKDSEGFERNSYGKWLKGLGTILCMFTQEEVPLWFLLPLLSPCRMAPSEWKGLLTLHVVALAIITVSSLYSYATG